MNRTRIIIGLVAFIAVMALHAQPAYAHVLIQDTTGKTGAVYHTTPDDDPIAGQPSTLYFSIENGVIRAGSISLTITDTNNKSTDVPITVNGEEAQARYTFASKGVYNLKLSIKNTSALTFNYAQRVSRGEGGTSERQNFPLATAGLIVSVIAMGGLAAVAYNHRKDIGSQSTF